MNDPILVANKVLEAAQNSDHKYVTPMRLIKLTYLSHAWMLGLHGRPLLNEQVEAWKFGPVVRTVYNAIRNYRDQPVPYPITPLSAPKTAKGLDANEVDIIEQVYDKYGDWDGIALSTVTHKPGSPWDVVWREHGQNAPISNDLIENYYKRLYRTLTVQPTPRM